MMPATTQTGMPQLTVIGVVLIVSTIAALLLLLTTYQHMLAYHPLPMTSTALAPRAVTSLARGTLTDPLLLLDENQNSIMRSNDDNDTTKNNHRVHVIILVHGWVGCPQDLGYIHQALEEQARQIIHDAEEKVPFYVYTCVSNHGRTNDGIQAGAERITAEIQQFLQNVQEQNEGLQEISLSILGYSLGGLYSRYALPNIIGTAAKQQQQQQQQQQPKIVPRVFCTIATPHLGSRGHNMFVKMPSFVEKAVGWVTKTGRDLFHHTPHIQNTVTDPHWIEPLLRFEKRIAYSNTYGMDFMVPTSTAAFLSKNSTSQHFHRPSASSSRSLGSDNEQEDPHATPLIPLVVETPAQHELLLRPPVTSSSSMTDEDMSKRLDAMGWTKVFVDFSNGYDQQQSPRSAYTSSDLHTEFKHSKKMLYLPVGHDLVAVNSKNVFSSYVNRKGRPVIDQLARDLVSDMVYGINNSNNNQSCKSV